MDEGQELNTADRRKEKAEKAHLTHKQTWRQNEISAGPAGQAGRQETTKFTAAGIVAGPGRMKKNIQILQEREK